MRSLIKGNYSASRKLCGRPPACGDAENVTKKWFAVLFTELPLGRGVGNAFVFRLEQDRVSL